MQEIVAPPDTSSKAPMRLTKYRDLKDELVGVPGSAEREQFEFELSLELIALKIKEYRRHHNLTQTELGALLGVQKTQISKLERNTVNVTLDTLLKVFKALRTRLKISFEPEAAG
jgi:DNA-binding XRE family transcriptional regulator